MMYLNALMENEDGREFVVDGILSTSKDVKLDTEKTTVTFEVEDKNFDKWVENYEHTDVQIWQDKINGGINPLIALDAVNNKAYVINDANENNGGTYVHWADIQIDTNSFPNGVKDLLAIISQ